MTVFVVMHIGTMCPCIYGGVCLSCANAGMYEPEVCVLNLSLTHTVSVLAQAGT